MANTNNQRQQAQNSNNSDRDHDTEQWRVMIYRWPALLVTPVRTGGGPGQLPARSGPLQVAAPANQPASVCSVAVAASILRSPFERLSNYLQLAIANDL